MTETQLEAAIELVNRVCSRDYQPGPAELGRPPEPERLLAPDSALPATWPPESLDAERRFGVPCARLYPYLGRKVHTPEGFGTLLQVFSDRCAVLLAPEAEKCRFFAPEDLEPVCQDVKRP